MRILITTMFMLCCVAAPSLGAPSKEECAALKKTRAEAQTAYNKARAKFGAADRECEKAWNSEQQVQKSLETNSNRIAVQQDFANDAATALAACQRSDPSKLCIHEKNEKKVADERLQRFKDRQLELKLDLAQAESWREQKEAELAAAHQEADAAKKALDAAIAAAVECKDAV